MHGTLPRCLAISSRSTVRKVGQSMQCLASQFFHERRSGGVTCAGVRTHLHGGATMMVGVTITGWCLVRRGGHAKGEKWRVHALRVCV